MHLIKPMFKYIDKQYIDLKKTLFVMSVECFRHVTSNSHNNCWSFYHWISLQNYGQCWHFQKISRYLLWACMFYSRLKCKIHKFKLTFENKYQVFKYLSSWCCLRHYSQYKNRNGCLKTHNHCLTFFSLWQVSIKNW